MEFRRVSKNASCSGRKETKVLSIRVRGSTSIRTLQYASNPTFVALKYTDIILIQL